MEPMLKITYEDKSNVVAIVNRPNQATAEDFNEIKEVVNSLIDWANLVGLPGFIYLAFASSNLGAGFTTIYNDSLPFIAILHSDVEIETPVASDFAGLWRYIMPEAPKNNTPYVRQDGAWIVLPGLTQTIFTIEVPTGDVSERAAGATSKPDGWTLAAAANPNDLEITHNLGRKFAQVTVSYMDGTEQVLLMGNLGYTGISAPSDDVLIIKSLSTKAFPLTIQLIFA